MNTITALVMNKSTTQTFDLPQGWTLRKVATALAREWLAPFRPDVVVKSARWVDKWTVLPVVEAPDDSDPLWEKGIATSVYEQRLECPDLTWSIQARSGRPRSLYNGIVLARLTMNPNKPMAFDVTCSRESLPETLFVPDKVEAFCQTHGRAGLAGLLASLLVNQGCRVAVGN